MNRCDHVAASSSSSSLFVDRIDRQDGGSSFNTRGFWQAPVAAWRIVRCAMTGLHDSGASEDGDGWVSARYIYFGGGAR
jgi:hypothetical protein